MQYLRFESSWDRTLAAQDRRKIESIFSNTKNQSGEDISFSPIREAMNHKEELLVSVLVHNFTEDIITFNGTRILYSKQGVILADNTFTLPKLAIPSQVSMPWTFIFPKDSYIPKTTLENGQLEILV